MSDFFSLLQTIVKDGPEAAIPNDTFSPQGEMSHLLGQTCICLSRRGDTLSMAFSNGGFAFFYHPQEEQEVVGIESITGPFHKLLLARLDSYHHRSDPAYSTMRNSAVWHTQMFRTQDDDVAVRWHAQPNGCDYINVAEDVYIPKTPLSAHDRLGLITAAKGHTYDQLA